MLGCGDSDKRFARGIFGGVGIFLGALGLMPKIFHNFLSFFPCWKWVSLRSVGGAFRLVPCQIYKVMLFSGLNLLNNFITQIHNITSRALRDQITKYKNGILLYKVMKKCIPDEEFVQMNFQTSRDGYLKKISNNCKPKTSREIKTTTWEKIYS